MSQAMAMSKEKKFAQMLGGDLVRLSSFAAWELDEFLSCAKPSFEVVKALASKIAKEMKLGFNGAGEPDRLAVYADPITAIVMNRAMAEASITQGEKDSVREIIKGSGEVVKLLQDISDSENPEARKDDIRKMRKFCLVLSKTARGFEPSPFDRRPSHPFWR